MTEAAEAFSPTSGRASVLEGMRYGQGPPLTLGVEEEYMILDARTLELTSKIEQVLSAVSDQSFSKRVMPELTESTVEIATDVCRTIDDAHRDLADIRRTLWRQLEPLNLQFASAGTHPFSKSEDQRITSRDRYRELVDQLQYLARREIVFGMHIHVAVPDPDTAIHVMEGVLIELPVLLALSCNSPFWRGKATGIASTRTAVFAGFPRSGLPPRFRSYEDYAESVHFMEETGVIKDYTRLWWDVRPHPRLGTIEVRVCDAQFDLTYTLALAAYVQALVAEILADVEAGNPPTSYHRMLVAENKWLAARYGLDAELMDLCNGSRERITVRNLVRRRMAQLEPHARELGCWDALQGVERIIADGTGAARQLRVYNANQDLYELMGELAEYSSRA
jgi:carboxylate-amine ligase